MPFVVPLTKEDFRPGVSKVRRRFRDPSWTVIDADDDGITTDAEEESLKRISYKSLIGEFHRSNGGTEWLTCYHTN